MSNLKIGNSIIHVLDETTANKIAAGEVVERPAAAVKELIENSIDAGSSNIEVEIEEGGLKFIRVSDNGAGMSPQDAKLAVKRHATSKIQTVDDLYKVSTLGFRGEALPSIAAVSKFSITTRRQKDEFATLVNIEGGTIKDVREAGAGRGTTVIVSDIFFNTPARRKFLKTPSTESGYISEAIGKLAISHPEISFKLINNRKITLQTNGNGSLLDVLANLYGPKAGQDVLPIPCKQEGIIDISVKGYIAKPILLKSSRAWQTFIVNERVISSKMLFKAVDNAYFSLLPKGGYPLVVLVISIPTDVIDVNVHPQKKEIKFSDEQKVFKAVHKAVLNALTNKAYDENEGAKQVVYGEYRPRLESGYKMQAEPPPPLVPSAASIPSTPSTPFLPSFDKTTNLASNKTVNKSIEYTRSMKKQSARQTSFQPELWADGKNKDIDSLSLIEAQKIISGDESFSIPFKENKKTSNGSPDSIALLDEDDASSLYPLGQIDSCYIVAYKRGGGGLYIIDQHAAHERILYEKFSQNIGKAPSQQLLVPLLLDFPPADCEAIELNKQTFNQLGFSFEQVGPSVMRLIEIPSDMPVGTVEEIVHQMLSMLGDLTQPTEQALRHAYLQTASCRAAVKSGDVLTMRQMQALISELGLSKSPYTCPHGRPTTIKFTSPELGKMFKRT